MADFAWSAPPVPVSIATGQVATAWPPSEPSPPNRFLSPISTAWAAVTDRATGAMAAASAASASARADAVALVDGSDIVLGVPIEDNGLVKVARRVIILAATGATFYTCHFIVDLMRGTYSTPSSGGSDSSSLWTAISSLLIQLSIPACGYYGALQSNRQLTCCFCSCNLFVTIVSIMSFIRLNIRIGELDGQCEKETNSEQRRTCELWTEEGMTKYLMICSTIWAICLGCLAFWFGNSLYQRLGQFTGSAPRALPLVGEVIDLSSVPTVLGASGTSYTTRPAAPMQQQLLQHLQQQQLQQPPPPPPPPPQQQMPPQHQTAAAVPGIAVGPRGSPRVPSPPRERLEEPVVDRGPRPRTASAEGARGRTPSPTGSRSPEARGRGDGSMRAM